MTVIPQRIPDVLLIQPKVHRDERGFFLESYNEARYASAGIAARFVQDNHSKSARRTLRGLHAQLKRPQGKLVRVLQGEVFDVAVDVRPGSATYGAWVGLRLTAESFDQLFIPAGFAHGFCVLSETAEFAYKVTDFYDAGDEACLRWDDPAIGIDWPIADPVLSAKDKAGLSLAEFEARRQQSRMSAA